MMEKKELSNGLNLPAVGLGTWLMGGAREADYSKDKETVEIIRQAIKLGYTHLDTAEMYGAGHCEELIGKAIQGMDRQKLVITSKVHASNLRYDDVLHAAKESLKRLQTPYIDLYLIHFPNPTIPLEETMKAFDELIDQGLVKYIGVSNFTLEELQKAQSCAKNPIVANQIEYSLLTRNKGRYADNCDMEKKTIPYCQENDILVVAERPIERGMILQHPLLLQLSEKYHKTPAQIAINWLIGQKNVVAIPKSANLNHLQENIGALGWDLDEKDRTRLNKTNFE